MRVKIWGGRGSLPSPLEPRVIEERIKQALYSYFPHGELDRAHIDSFIDNLPPHRLGGYGGNSVCVEVRSQNEQVIIDGGSGIRPLGYDMMHGPCHNGTGKAHVLFTHFHWDHILGLPFFIPLFIPGNEIHVYAVQKELQEMFKILFRKPYFPLNLNQLGAKIIYHELEPRKTFEIGDIKITPYQLDHTDPCWGYRFESGGKVYSHCVDTECKRVSREQLGPDLSLYQGVDVLLFDAQYTLIETLEKVDWGHAAALIGLDVAIREGVKRILFTHHDPASSDEKIAAAEAEARRYLEGQVRQCKRENTPIPSIEWGFAYEGMSVQI